MHITGMTIEGILPFTDKVEFEFDEHVNVFVGPNASGKSVALRSLESRTPVAARFDFHMSADWDIVLNDEPFVRRMTRGVNLTPNRKHGADFVPWTYIPAGRINLPLTDDGSAMSDLHAEGVPRIFIDDELEDAMHSNRSINLSHLLQNAAYAFDGRTVHKVYRTLTDRIRMKRESNDDLILYDSAERIASQCAQQICREILPQDGRAVDFFDYQTTASGTVPVTNVHDKMARATTDSDEAVPFLGDLSSGTQGTLLWLWFLALKIAEFHKQHYSMSRDNPSGWTKDHAILLIDEMENNLHPTWQRRVIPALLEHFPGLQIFATTHSPFVVAGLKAGQVHLLNRDENGVVTATTNTEDIVGWTADEILRVFMGVDDPTDKDTAEAAAALRKLRDEGPRVDEREEERRQSEIARLRQIVDRAELSGPRVAEDARFLADLESILERHRESQELNQENG